MRIFLSPQRRDDTLTVIVSGDVLMLNGEVLDFSQLPDGATLPRGSVSNEWLFGDVHRVDGVIELTLILPIAADASEAACFPEPLNVLVDGLVELPT